VDGLGLNDAPAPPAAAWGLAISRIGLTGGIGSGKSTVAAMLAGCGVCVVDTDAIARELTAPGGAAMPALQAAFGADIADARGALDRSRMRALAFADPAARSRLEAVLHPLIQAVALQRDAAAGVQPVVFDVPLLAESAHWRARVQRIVVVDCSAETQIARVAARPGWTADAARAVIAQQASRATRRAIADAVIANGGHDRDKLAAEVHALARLWGLVGAAG
jgi:dephospho-CoA kinase